MIRILKFTHGPTHCRSPRSGTATVEAAITLILMLNVFFAMLDLGLLVFQSNMLSLATRRLTREAIVRGAIDTSAAWGPGLVSGTADDGTAIAQVIRPYCVSMTRPKVTVLVTWPDGTNRIDDRVTTRLTYQRQPMTPLTSWMGTIKLNATATMRIVH